MPESDHGSPDLSTLIRRSLTELGETTEADVFRRWLSESWAFKLNQHSAQEMRDQLSVLLGQVRGDQAMSIAEHDDLRETVVVISLTQLAKTLGSVAIELEQLSHAGARDPIAMFSALDRLPEVREADAIIPERHRRRHLTLNLD